ncbi:MAG: metallophosphoesterase family protein [Saccharofermentanales bacterium]|jgi:exonuclease SbcD
MSVHFIHTADLHLGNRMASLGRHRDDFREALIRSFDRLLETTAREKATALLIAGDFLEANEIDDREIEAIRRLLLRPRPFVVLLAAGNHDPHTSASIYATRLTDIPGFHVFSAEDTERVDFPDHDLSVYGQSFGSLYQRTPRVPIPGREARVWTATEGDLVASDATVAPCRQHVGMVHGTLTAGAVAPNDPAALYNPLQTSDFADLPFAYLALGHIHKPSTIPDLAMGGSGAPVALYPGSPQGISFNEPGPRHALSVEMADGAVTAIRPLITSDRLFLPLTVDVDAADAYDDVCHKIERAAQDAAGSDIARHAYRIVLQGTCDETFRADRVAAKLSDRSFGHFTLRDELSVAIDADALRKEKTLRGWFVDRLMTEIEATDDEPTKTELLRALRIGLEAFNGEIVFRVD